MILQQKSSLECILVPHISLLWLKKTDREIWVEYREVIEEYVEKGIMICEDDQELERILYKADAYYGAAGFLAHRCRLLGKPVMIGMGSVSGL